MVQGESVMRNEGMFGFDWAIYKGNDRDADADMRIPIFTTERPTSCATASTRSRRCRAGNTTTSSMATIAGMPGWSAMVAAARCWLARKTRWSAMS